MAWKTTSNDSIRQGIREILTVFDNNNLFALAATITRGLSKNQIKSREDALNAIINYSPDQLSILKRKIVTREILFAYLNRKNIPLEVPATKIEIINRIVHFWNNKQITVHNTTDSGTIEALAQQFVAWFYPMLNTDECLNPAHFYPDARLKINLVSNNEVITEIVENNTKELVRKLYEVRTKFNLVFNPNLTQDGVKGDVDSHGLVALFVCGTLHSSDICVGIFEQMFALARDPEAENNWKIKWSEVNLKNQAENVYSLTNMC